MPKVLKHISGLCQQIAISKLDWRTITVRVEFAILFAVFFLSTAHGQTIADFERDYGKPTYAYSLSEHIWMTPEYTSDGQVCRARIYPKRISNGTEYLSKELPFQELKDVLNQLIPPRLRGAVKQPFNVTDTGGGAGWTTYSYEKVSIMFIFSVSIDPNKWKESPTFRVEDFPPKQQQQRVLSSDDDFPFGDGTQIVIINWTNRKCGLN